MQEAGADAILEMAFTIADGLEYCRTGNFLQLHACMYSVLLSMLLQPFLHIEVVLAFIVGVAIHVP